MNSSLQLLTMGPKERKTSQRDEDTGTISNSQMTLKRKLPPESKKSEHKTVVDDDYTTNDVDPVEQKYDLLGTITNEEDTSDEDQEDNERSDSDSDNENYEFGSESEELSIEEDDCGEVGSNSSLHSSGNESLEEGQSSNMNSLHDFGSFTKALISSLEEKNSIANKDEKSEARNTVTKQLPTVDGGEILKRGSSSRTVQPFAKVIKERMEQSRKMKRDQMVKESSTGKSESTEKLKLAKNFKKREKSDNKEVTKPFNEFPKCSDKQQVKDLQPEDSPGENLEKKEDKLVDEYDSDSSDEEDIRNTIGNVPLKWYDDYDHVGYDWEGKKIKKPPSGDELDNFLRKMEDPNFWRTVKDPQTGEDVILCDADANLINRLQTYKIPDPDFNEYAPWIEWFSSDVMKMPLRKFPDHKRSFIPSKDEAKKVSRLVHAMKMGWIKPRQEKSKEIQFYNLWETDDTAEHMRRIHNHIPAPKRSLPSHAESYNPPPEYLFDKIELRQWKSFKNTPSKRKLHFVPQKFNSLREVPSYDRYVKERFLRCLDLYLCPRARKMRLLIEPEDLVPQLPSPKDLQPFPTTQSLIYEGHVGMVRTITVEPKGQYLASGSDDMTVKIWEVSTGRCIRTIPAGGIVRCISWCPNVALSLLAVAADKKLLLINPDVGDILVVKKTDSLLEEHSEQDVLVSERVKSAVQWEQSAGTEWEKGVRIIINHFKEIKQVTWHGRGDYFATVMTDAHNRAVIIHQVSKRRSQIPFNKSKGLVQCVLFHPIRPIFFVATQKNIRVYDLVKQEIMKKLMSNAKWISSMAVHPAGDNLLVGTYDRKILWFDLDLSTKPYQTLRLHSYAVRGVAYHKRYPLFASGSDDNSVIVSHGMVYNDLLKNPLIVPLKRMSYHEKQNDFSVLDIVFHPSQPWIFSSGADGTVRLYT